MDLTIPMRQTNHSKEVVEMVKGREKLYAQTKKLLEQAQKWCENISIKHEDMWNLRLDNTCGWTFRILRCPIN